MKDLFSKVTFGFVMAQLVPGTIAASSVLVLFVSAATASVVSLSSAVRLAVADFTSSVPEQVVVLGLFVGVGMVIHGLQWAVIGFLETRFGSMYDSYWHDRLLSSGLSRFTV